MTNPYIINEVLCDYTDGTAVIAAASLERARELFAEFVCQSQIDDFDAAIKGERYKVLQVVDQPEGVISYVFGGS